jgi:hypothetical protein
MQEANARTIPDTQHRTVIIGRNGSGKSVAGAHTLLLYRERYPTFPWIIFNPKGDKLLDSIGAERADLTKHLTKHPLGEGMRIYSPVPETDDDEHVNAILEQALWHENVGLYFDEGYSIPTNSKPYRRAQTQGRSKRVPIITLTQRPVFLDKFTFTEASFFQVFDLVDTNDKKKVRENTGIQMDERLLPYHSHWYEVNSGRRYKMTPVPNEDVILQRFRDLQPKKKGFLSWL